MPGPMSGVLSQAAFLMFKVDLINNFKKADRESLENTLILFC